MKLPCDSYKIDVCLSGVCSVCVPLIVGEELEEIAAVKEPIEIPVPLSAHKRSIKERSM
nr:hypothetical protein [Candidatus Njordarchaeum guaymaensis]